MQAIKVKWNVRDVLAEAKVEGNACLLYTSDAADE